MTRIFEVANLDGSLEEQMSEQRKITDEADARRCLSAARRGSQDLKAWAQANGVDGRSLNAWRMNLERRGTKRGARSSPTTALVARPRTALVELVPAPKASTARYAVHVDALRVEIGDDFDPRTLQRIIEVLRTC